MVDVIAEAVRPAMLYLPITSEVTLEYQLKRLVVHETLSRTRPPGLSLAINADVLRRAGFTMKPVPAGEQIDGRLADPILAGAIVALHIDTMETLGKWFEPLRSVHGVPLVGHSPEVKQVLNLWHMLQRKPAEPWPEPPAAKPMVILRAFNALSKLEQEQLLGNIHRMVSWLEGWQMEEGGHGSYARLFHLLQRAVVPRYANSLQTIYRSAYLKTDLSDVIGDKRLITSPHQFQSWTTTAGLATTIAERNLLAAGSPTAPYLTVFEAAIDDVDLVATARDLYFFVRALMRTHRTERLWDNLRTASGILEKVLWQDEVIVRSPVNRKIVARVHSVSHTT